MKEKKNILSTHAVATYLGVHPFSVARYIDQGTLQGFRTQGGHRRVAASELRRYLLERDIPIPLELAGAGSKVKLLVVDDETASLNAIRRAFKPLSSEVELTMVRSGFEALLLLGHLRPDGLLIDLAIPGLDCFDLCQRVTDFEPLAGLTLVAMTSVHRTDFIGSALRAGAVACLKKPVNPREVLGLIRKLAARRRTRPSGA